MPSIAHTAKLRFKQYQGLSGIPYRAFNGEGVPDIKEDDPAHIRPQQVADGHVRIFDLSNVKDLADYTKIVDDVAKGHMLISREEIHWDTQNNKYVVFLRWLSLWLEKPGRLADDSVSH
jgi:hypothetical protein